MSGARTFVDERLDLFLSGKPMNSLTRRDEHFTWFEHLIDFSRKQIMKIIIARSKAFVHSRIEDFMVQ